MKQRMISLRLKLLLAIVLLVLGTLLYYALTARKLDQRLFSAKN